MERLCERPGCSDPASVGYGMVPEDLVFWLDVTIVGDDFGVGVLCRRHADSMVVPGGWTLDDRRDPELHLFRPPAGSAVGRRGRPRRPSTSGDTQQLRLGEEPPETAPAADDGASEPWSPSFDTDDDLDGLLSATSPLLARAFRGDGRPPSA